MLEYQSLEYDSFDEEIDGKSNVALLMVLFFKYTHKIVCVANTHILFNPKRGDIKLTQLSILLGIFHSNIHKFQFFYYFLMEICLFFSSKSNFSQNEIFKEK